MQETEHNLESNPGRALAGRLVVACIGGLLVYVALPHPLDVNSWWDQTAGFPFIAGVIALAFAILAPSRWCEFFIFLVP
jgi:hypothetical protein